MGDKKKIFLIENEFTSRVSLHDKLRKKGFEVEVGNGDEAVQKIDSFKPDIVISDVDTEALGDQTHFIHDVISKTKLKPSDIFICCPQISVNLEVQLRRLKLNNYFEQNDNTDFLVDSVARYFNPVEEDLTDPFEYSEPEPPVYQTPPQPAATPAEAPPPAEQTDEERFGEMLGEFSDKVHDQLGDKDAETYYNLGISYMDMGLHTEAIKEFLLAQKDEQFKLESASMIGICLRKIGKLPEAIAKFQVGAKMATDPVEIMGFRYEIGVTLQEMGKLKEAFNFLGVVYKADKTYRDVHRRLVELKGSLKAKK